MELILVMAISAIVGSLLVILLIQTNNSFLTQNGRVDRGVSLSEGLNLISSDIQNAANVSASYPPNYLTSGNTLILKLPAVGSDGNLVSNSFDTVVYLVDSNLPNILRRQVFPSPQSTRPMSSQVVISNLNKVQFSYFDLNNLTVDPVMAAKVEVLLEVKTSSGANLKTASLDALVKLKNK